MAFACSHPGWASRRTKHGLLRSSALFLDLVAWLIDGNNVLGVMRLDRHDVEPKRELARLAASFARAKKTRLTCFFDGLEPANFARHLGATTIVFSGTRSADELIIERVASGRGWNVVTADRQLASRIAGRQVKIVEPAAFVAELQALERESPDTAAEDWLSYFSDPENREKF